MTELLETLKRKWKREHCHPVTCRFVEHWEKLEYSAYCVNFRLYSSNFLSFQYGRMCFVFCCVFSATKLWFKWNFEMQPHRCWKRHLWKRHMKVKSEREVVTQSCPTLSNPMDYSLPGPSIHGIFQARVLEWVAIAFSLFSVMNGLLGVSK